MQKLIRQRQLNQEVQALTASSVLNRVYSHRGVEDPDELDYSLSRLQPYHQLKGIDCQSG